MSKCKIDLTPHEWVFGYLVKDTRPFPEAVWLCSCGAMKKVEHHLQGFMHPDDRIAAMKARAEAREENDEL